MVKYILSTLCSAFVKRRDGFNGYPAGKKETDKTKNRGILSNKEA